MADDKFVPIPLESIPKDGDGNVSTDLYIHLPTANRFVCYVIKGDELSARKIDALKSHVEPRLFVPADVAGELRISADPVSTEPKEGIRVDALKDEYRKVFAAEGLPENLKVEIVTKETEKELRDMYKAILDPNAPDIPTVVDKLQTMASDIINVVAPEVKDIKTHLLRNTKYLRVMNDSSAISSLAVLFGLANGFDSQRSYKELAYATLVMDVSLSEFDETTVNTFFTNPESLDPATLARLKAHPVKSHQLATEKLKSVTEVTKQLILTHHELHNGKGYPRGIRTDSIFPIARILSLAVDVFQELRKDELTAKTYPTLQVILQGFLDNDPEPHSRRHNTKLIQTTLKFLGVEDAASGAPPDSVKPPA